MHTVFLDYDTVRRGEDGLDPSPLERAAGAIRYYGLTEDAEIAERIGAADIVLLNKVRLSPHPRA